MKLLGHVVRAENNDPMRQVMFRSGRVEELHVGKRRVGKPKLDWVRQGKIQVWEKSDQRLINRIRETLRKGENLKGS